MLELYVIFTVKMKQNHKGYIFSPLLSLNCIENAGRESLQQNLEQ